MDDKEDTGNGSYDALKGTVFKNCKSYSPGGGNEGSTWSSSGTSSATPDDWMQSSFTISKEDLEAGNAITYIVNEDANVKYSELARKNPAQHNIGFNCIDGKYVIVTYYQDNFQKIYPVDEARQLYLDFLSDGYKSVLNNREFDITKDGETVRIDEKHTN